VGVIAVKASGDPTVELEFAETAFDEISLSVELFIVPVLVFASAFGWNNRLHSFGSDGGVDLTLGNEEPTGKLIRQILGAVAEWEKCALVQKLRASRLRMRRSGQRCEGRKPYGLTPEEQAVIERIQAMRKEKKSFVDIAAALNAEGVPTRTGPGTKWHPTQIQRILGRQA
jgi:hypothetical protein